MFPVPVSTSRLSLECLCVCVCVSVTSCFLLSLVSCHVLFCFPCLVSYDSFKLCSPGVSAFLNHPPCVYCLHLPLFIITFSLIVCVNSVCLSIQLVVGLQSVSQILPCSVIVQLFSPLPFVPAIKLWFLVLSAARYMTIQVNFSELISF